MKIQRFLGKVAALALASFAFVATSCSGLIDKADEPTTTSEKATVRFGEASARTIMSTFTNTDYKYELSATKSGTTTYLLADGKTNATSDKMDYTQLEAAGWELEAGDYTFTLNAYKETTTGEGEEAKTDYTKVLTADDTKTLTAGETTTLSFTLKGVSGEGLTGSISVTVDFSGSTAEKDNVKAAKVAFGNTIADADNATDTGVTLDKTAYTVTYTNDAVKAATTQYVTFFFYDDVGALKGRYTESVYVLAGDTVSKTRAIDALNKDKYPYTVYSQDFEDVTDVTTVAASPNYSAGLSIANGALSYSCASQNTRNAYTTESFNAPVSGQYVIAFDAALTAATGSDGTSELAVRTTKASTNGKDGCNTTSTGNYLFKMTAPVSSTTWTLNDSDSTTVELTAGTAYHYTILVDIDNSKVYATIDGTDIKNLEVTPASGITTYTADNINFVSGRTNSVLTLDNIVVKSDTDLTVITADDLTVALGTAVAATEGSTTKVTCAGGTVSLTASATAQTVVEETSKDVSYAWAITSGSDYATLSAESGESVTLTANANETLTNHAVTVKMTASADGATSVSKTYTLTVAADSTKLSDITITGDTSVSMGSEITLTASSTNSGTGSETVTYAWAATVDSETTSAVTLTPGTDDTSTCTVKGVTQAESVTITVTATAGSVTKTATTTIAVTASTATLSSLTLSAETLSVANTKTGTFTVTPNDGLVPTYTVESSNTEACTVTGEAADTGVYTVTITPVANGNATITVTATLDSVTKTATCAVTIKDPTKVTLYSQDFESGETDWTIVGSRSFEVVADSNTGDNRNTSDYIYHNVTGNTGDAGAQVAVAATGSVTVECDFRLDYPYLSKSSCFALLGAANSSAWLASDSEILSFVATASSSANGAAGSFTVNGTDILEQVGANANEDHDNKRSSTGWLHMVAELDFTTHTLDLTLTKINTFASDEDDSVVYSVTDLDFMDGEAASSLQYIFMCAGKTCGESAVDNIEVYTYE